MKKHEFCCLLNRQVKSYIINNNGANPRSETGINGRFHSLAFHISKDKINPVKTIFLSMGQEKKKVCDNWAVVHQHRIQRTGPCANLDTHYFYPTCAAKGKYTKRKILIWLLAYYRATPNSSTETKLTEILMGHKIGTTLFTLDRSLLS